MALFVGLLKVNHQVCKKKVFRKIRKRTCEVNRIGEDSSFSFTCYVKTVPVYDSKLIRVILHPSVKEFFKTIN